MSCLDLLHDRSFSRYSQRLNDHDMKWSCTIGLASKSSMPPLFLKDCSSLCLQKSARIRWVQPKLMALRILYHPIIPMIEAQPVPKLRLPRIDKLGRSLVQFPTFLDRCIRKYDAPKKKTSGVYSCLGKLRVSKPSPRFVFRGSRKKISWLLEKSGHQGQLWHHLKLYLCCTDIFVLQTSWDSRGAL